MAASDPAESVPIETLLLYRDWVRALARRLHGDESRADDAEQETWRRTLERPPRHAGALRAWFARAVRNTATSSGRKERTRSAYESAASPPPGAASPADVVAAAEVHAKLIRAVLDLDEPYRSSVLLRYFHGLEAREIATRTSVPVETVRTHLKRAVERLRERMTVELRDDDDAWCLLLCGRRGVGTTSTPIATRAAVVTTGGMLMAMSTAKSVAAVVLATIAGGAWWLLRPEAVGEDGLRAVATTTPPVVQVVPRTHREPPGAEPAPSVPAPSPPRLVGFVVDAGGAPASGVRVVFLPERPSAGTTVDLAAASAKTSFAETTTGVDGSFSAEPLSSPGLAAALALREDGYAARVDAIRPGEPVTLRLLAPASLVGRITDPTGTAIANARVVVGCLVDVGSLVRETRSDAQGEYRIATLPPSRGGADAPCCGAQVTFSAEGFAQHLVAMTSEDTRFAAGEQARIDATLSRGAVVVGTVVEAGTGRPVDGATVELVCDLGRMGFQLPRGRGVENPFAPTTIATAQSAADGVFRFDHVPAADPKAWAARVGVVRAVKTGYAVAEAEVAAAPSGSRIDVRLELRHPFTVVGRVVDAAGALVPGLKIWARAGDERNAASATTDAAGRYRLESLPRPAAADSAVVVRAFRSYEDRDRFAAENCRVEVPVGAGDTTFAPDLVWIRPDWPIARLLFVDETGAPVRDAVVESAGDAIALVRGDDAGRAELVVRPFPATFPRPWPSRRLVVRAPGRAPAGVTVPPEPSDGQEFRVVLQPGRDVSGRVLSADGAARAGVLVRALAPDVDPAVVFDPERRTSLDSLAEKWSDVPFLGAAETDAKGEFVLRDAPDGPFTVGVSAGGYGEWTEVRDVRGGTAGLELRLPDAEAAAARIGARVTLDVKDESGAPLPASALATGVGGVRRSGRLPGFRLGLTAFPALPPGTWRLRVDCEGFVPWVRHDFVVEKGQRPDPIAVELRCGAAVAGRVSLPAGVETGGRSVLLLSDSGELATAPLAPDGSFRQTGLACGRYRVAVAPVSWFVDANPAFVAADGGLVRVTAETGEFRLDTTFVPAGAVTVELSDRRLPLSGNACDEARWKFGAESAAEIRTAAGVVVHATRGLARLNAFRHLVLPVGRYAVRVTYPVGETAEQEFDVVAGKTAAVTVGTR